MALFQKKDAKTRELNKKMNSLLSSYTRRIKTPEKPESPSFMSFAYEYKGHNISPVVFPESIPETTTITKATVDFQGYVPDCFGMFIEHSRQCVKKCDFGNPCQSKVVAEAIDVNKTTLEKTLATETPTETAGGKRKKYNWATEDDYLAATELVYHRHGKTYQKLTLENLHKFQGKSKRSLQSMLSSIGCAMKAIQGKSRPTSAMKGIYLAMSEKGMTDRDQICKFASEFSGKPFSTCKANYNYVEKTHDSMKELGLLNQ